MRNMSALKVPEMSPAIAEKLLMNVFDSCQREPNTIPLAKLETYSEYRRERYSFQKVLILVLLAVFLLVPIFLISPDFTVLGPETEDPREKPVYEVRVNNVMPVKLVTASINDRNVAVYETDKQVYSMEPAMNGTMTVRVMLLNRQWVEKEIQVTSIDTDPPRLVDSSSDGKYLTLQVTDDGLGVDFEGIYSKGDSGVVCKPISVQEETGTVIFAFPTESVSIYIPDRNQNVLQLAVTITN